MLLFSGQAIAQDYPFDITFKWTCPTHNTDESVLTDLESTRLVCERDSVQFIDRLINSEGHEGQVQNAKLSITMDGLVTCRIYAINAWGRSSDPSNEYSKRYGPPLIPTTPNAINDLKEIR